MNVGYPNKFAVQRMLRESDMSIVVFDDRKGKSGRSEGTLL